MKRIRSILDLGKVVFSQLDDDQPPAEMLKEVQYSYKKKEELCVKCNYFKNQLSRSLHFKCKDNCPNGI